MRIAILVRPATSFRQAGATKTVVAIVASVLVVAVGAVLAFLLVHNGGTPKPTHPTVSALSSPLPTATATPAPTPSPTAATDRLQAQSVGVTATLTEVPCDATRQSIVPTGGDVEYSDCQTYFWIIGSSSGPLSGLKQSQAGTVVTWVNSQGSTSTCTISGAGVTVQRYGDGTFPGHGIPQGKHAFIDLRDQTSQIEYDCAP